MPTKKAPPAQATASASTEAARKGTATRAHAPQIEGATVLTLYRQANLPGAPIAEAGPVARLSFVPTATKDDPSFWYAYTVVESEAKKPSIWRPFSSRHYFITADASSLGCNTGYAKRHARLLTNWDCVESAIDAYEANLSIQWCNGLEHGLMWATRFESDVLHIVNPEAHLDGHTLEQFAHGVLLALFGEGALYDLREEAAA